MNFWGQDSPAREPATAKSDRKTYYSEFSFIATFGFLQKLTDRNKKIKVTKKLHEK
jgi:hypothetical protein